MVTFICQLCNATLKKNQVNKHCESVCPDAWTFVCIDCRKDFHGYEFESHTQCMTEAEKYHGKFAQKKEKAKKKTEEWRGWKNTIKGILKTAGKGLDYESLVDQVMEVYAHSNHTEDNPRSTLKAKLKNRKFVRREGKRKDLTITSLWNRSCNDRVHRDKLRSIKKRPLLHVSLDNNKFAVNLRRANYLITKEREKKILQGNARLFKKLNEIIDQKRSVSVQPRHASTNKSLNCSYKKQEAARISTENEAFANRLCKKHSELNYKKLLGDYKVNATYRRQISRSLLLKRLQKVEQKPRIY